VKRGWLIWQTPHSGWTKSWSGKPVRYYFYVSPEADFVSCTCPSFSFRGKCKHTEDAIEHLIRENNRLASQIHMGRAS